MVNPSLNINYPMGGWSTNRTNQNTNSTESINTTNNQAVSDITGGPDVLSQDDAAQINGDATTNGAVDTTAVTTTPVMPGAAAAAADTSGEVVQDPNMVTGTELTGATRSFDGMTYRLGGTGGQEWTDRFGRTWATGGASSAYMPGANIEESSAALLADYYGDPSLGSLRNMAKGQAQQAAAARGLQNTTLSAQAGELAALQVLTPLAQQDAGYRQDLSRLAFQNNLSIEQMTVQHGQVLDQMMLNGTIAYGQQYIAAYTDMVNIANQTISTIYTTEGLTVAQQTNAVTKVQNALINDLKLLRSVILSSGLGDFISDPESGGGGDAGGGPAAPSDSKRGPNGGGGTPGQSGTFTKDNPAVTAEDIQTAKQEYVYDYAYWVDNGIGGTPPHYENYGLTYEQARSLDPEFPGTPR